MSTTMAVLLYETPVRRQCQHTILKGCNREDRAKDDEKKNELVK